MPVVRLNEGGILTIPEDVLEQLGFGAGDLISLEIVDSALHLTKISSRSPVPSSDIVRTLAARKKLATPIQYVKGVGPRIASLLAKKGVETVEDALYLLPLRYEDRRSIHRIADLRPGMPALFMGTVITAGNLSTKGGRRYFEALVGDQSGKILLKWFNYNPAFMKKIWQPGRCGVFSGETSHFGFQLEIHHPEVDWVGDDATVESIMAADPLSFGRIVPVYPLTEGLGQKTMRRLMKIVVDEFADSVLTAIPDEVVTGLKLSSLAESLHRVHFPDNMVDPEVMNKGADQGHKVLSFDEFFFLELGLALKRQGTTLELGIPFRVTHRYTRKLLEYLPYSLTAAQKKVLAEIKVDMMAPHPMHRLVQGDVGSGKTVVAFMAALIALENDCQVAFMAPTEILAEQHYLTIHTWCEQLGLRPLLLTASLKGKARKEALAAISSGSAQIVIGTHAVIQEKVEFHRLGLGIVDEQHRFGVLQRATLKGKGENPDILVMTATPIPRTLAMTIYGDMSLSVIDQLPPGRTPIRTKVCPESARRSMYGAVRDEIRHGHQAYIIYPLVDETEKSELKAATSMSEHLSGEIFPDLRIGLLHGRMKPEEKEAVMRAFKARETDILVATTVIEVGIDVPNASLMVIEHAERFGLSQLHQLRGRVGRGTAQSSCLLMASDRLSQDAQKRLQVMVSTTDGFKIAEADLDIRGPGDFLGTRQAGLPDLRVAHIIRDAQILELARREAFALVEREPSLSKYPDLRQELLHRWGGRLHLASIA